MDNFTDKTTEYKKLIAKAADAYLAGDFSKALNIYNETMLLTSKLQIGTMPKYLLKYMISSCLIELGGLDNLAEGVYLLQSFDKIVKQRFPTLYLLLAQAHLKLYRFKEALDSIKYGLFLLKSGNLFETFYIPGTTIIINRSINDNIWKKTEQDCLNYCAPDAVCFFENCNYITKPYVTANRIIYKKDPAFNGMIIIKCNNLQNQCIVKCHPFCWKTYKDSLSKDLVLSDKDILGTNCLSSKCRYGDKHSTILSIEVIGKNGETIKLFENSQLKIESRLQGAIKKPIKTYNGYNEKQIVIVNEDETKLEVNFSHESPHEAQRKQFLFSIFHDYIRKNLVSVSDIYAKFNEYKDDMNLKNLDILTFLLSTNKFKILDAKNELPYYYQETTIIDEEIYSDDHIDIKRLSAEKYHKTEVNGKKNENLHAEDYNNNNKSEMDTKRIYRELMSDDESDCNEEIQENLMEQKNNKNSDESTCFYYHDEYSLPNSNKLEKVSKEYDFSKKEVKYKNQIDILKKQLEDNNKNWSIVNKTVNDLKTSYKNVTEENLIMKTKMIKMMEINRELEEKLSKHDDPENRRLKLMKIFQEEYKILEDRINDEWQTKYEELKKTLKMETDTKMALLKKCLNNQYSSIRHLIVRYTDQCQATLDAINKINSYMEKTQQIRQFFDSTEFVVAMNGYQKALTESQIEYRKLMYKLHSDSSNDSNMQDITMSYPSMPSLPSNNVGDVAIAALNTLQIRYNAMFALQRQPLPPPPNFLVPPPCYIPPVIMPIQQQGPPALGAPLVQIPPAFPCPPQLMTKDMNTVLAKSYNQMQQQMKNVSKEIIQEMHQNLDSMNKVEISEICASSKDSASIDVDNTPEIKTSDILEKEYECAKDKNEDSDVFTLEEIKNDVGNNQIDIDPSEKIEDELLDSQKSLEVLSWNSQNTKVEDEKIQEEPNQNIPVELICEKQLDNYEKTKHDEQLQMCDDTLNLEQVQRNSKLKKKANIDCLMKWMKLKYPGALETDLLEIIMEVRKKNNNSLTGLSVRQILNESEEFFLNNQHIHLIDYCVDGHEDSTKHPDPIKQNVKKKTRFSVFSPDSFVQKASVSSSPIVQKKTWNTLPTEEIKWTAGGEMECSICMNVIEISKAYTLSCQHAFHARCVKPWLKNDRSCPNCRTVVTEDDEFPPLPVNRV